jgi:hypothetical protein
MSPKTSTGFVQPAARDVSEPGGREQVAGELVVPALEHSRGEAAMPQSRPQKETMERVMHEFKRGDLKTSRGTKVKSQKQAVAIGLHEAGASKYESKAENKKNLARTKRREHAGATAKKKAH